MKWSTEYAMAVFGLAAAVFSIIQAAVGPPSHTASLVFSVLAWAFVAVAMVLAVFLAGRAEAATRTAIHARDEAASERDDLASELAQCRKSLERYEVDALTVRRRDSAILHRLAKANRDFREALEDLYTAYTDLCEKLRRHPARGPAAASAYAEYCGQIKAIGVRMHGAVLDNLRDIVVTHVLSGPREGLKLTMKVFNRPLDLETRAADQLDVTVTDAFIDKTSLLEDRPGSQSTVDLAEVLLLASAARESRIMDMLRVRNVLTEGERAGWPGDDGDLAVIVSPVATVRNGYRNICYGFLVIECPNPQREELFRKDNVKDLLTTFCMLLAGGYSTLLAFSPDLFEYMVTE